MKKFGVMSEKLNCSLKGAEVAETTSGFLRTSKTRASFDFVFLILLFFILLAGFAIAANKIEISTTKPSFSPGENVSFKVSVYDSNNNPIQGDVKVTLEDANKNTQLEHVVAANDFVDVQLPDDAYYGFWTIIASYRDNNGDVVEGTTLFTVEKNAQVKFDLTNDVLTITNVGNAPYDNEVQIAIGDIIGTKKISLAIGEKISVRLTAPDGEYNIRISDGTTSFTRGQVQLTGNVVGVFDNNAGSSSPITGVSPDKSSFSNFTDIFKSKNIIYLFLATIIGAAVLLAIERNYRRKLGS